MTPAAQLLDAIVPLVRTRLPRGVDVDYLDDFLARNRFALEAVIEQNLGPVLARMQVANRPFIEEDIPEFWTVSKRTAANIAAMAVAANLYAQRRLPTADERATLTGYSGWGGLSIQAASGKFPAGFPVPEERGLIHQRVRSRNSRARRYPPAARPSSCGVPGWASRRLPRRPRPGRRPRAPGSRPRGSRCR